MLNTSMLLLPYASQPCVFLLPSTISALPRSCVADMLASWLAACVLLDMEVIMLGVLVTDPSPVRPENLFAVPALEVDWLLGQLFVLLHASLYIIIHKFEVFLEDNRSNIILYLKSLQKLISMNQSFDKYLLAFRFKVYIANESKIVVTVKPSEVANMSVRNPRPKGRNPNANKRGKGNKKQMRRQRQNR